MKHLQTTLLLLAFALCSMAQPAVQVAKYVPLYNGDNTRVQIEKNPNVSACNHYAYPGPKQFVLTPTPKGYEPFYLSHYGRHGSRWLIGHNEYSAPLKVMLEADSLGILTDLGKKTLKELKALDEASQKRLGELTLLGAQQHRGIAHRMFRRFPEIFSGHRTIDARSTTVFRVTLSMENALQEFCRLNPDLYILHDVSEHDMYYMNHHEQYLDTTKFRPEVQRVYDEYCKKHETYETVLPRLFTDEHFWREQIKSQKFVDRLFKVAGNLQSTELRHDFTLWDVFTSEELYQQWLKTNAWWYINFGPSPLNQGMQPFSQINLLRNIIETADTCIVLNEPPITLRYGHEVNVLPLTCLLECDEFGLQIQDLDNLDEEGWHSQRIFPMACNLQFVFYRNKKDPSDVLVKVLLNENEVRLPLPGKQAPYYKWSDFRTYYLKKIDRYLQWQRTAQRSME